MRPVRATAFCSSACGTWKGRRSRELVDEEGALGLDRTLSLLRPVADALDAAHAHGLVHRDVKPANILINRAARGGGEHVYLSDFGVTKRTDSVSGLTRTGQFMGTIDYVAPEQIRGEAATGAADQYSLGCVAFECLTGAPPFRKDTDVAVMWAHVNDPPPPVSGALPGVPTHSLDSAIGRAMAKAPGDRFSTCSDFLAAAAGSVGAGEVPGDVEEVPSRRGKLRALRPWWGAAGAVLAVAAGVIAWAAVWAGDGTPTPPGPGRSTPAPLPTLDRGVNRIDLSTNRSVANRSEERRVGKEC